MMELAASRALPDEEHVDLSSLNNEICSEYEEFKFEREIEKDEEVEIPPEYVAVDVQEEAYRNLVNYGYPVALAENSVRRELLNELYQMGFSNFSLNTRVLTQCNGNIAEACDMLLDEESMSRMFGSNFRLI